MKKSLKLLPLFKKFIKDTETGKRLKKNGERIKQGSIDNYYFTMSNLVKFSTATGFELRICDTSKLTKREFLSEKNYWKKFYKKFTEFLYKKGCYDNYVGGNIKVIRTFFNYLKFDKDINTGDFHRLFYVRHEQIEILVLSVAQLKFLTHNQEFEASLNKRLQKIKDMFVFGCTTGLRYSDLVALTNKNFVQQENGWYLKIKSQKTKTFSYVKLPEYAVNIYFKYKPKSARLIVFDGFARYSFNKYLKVLGEKANFIAPVNISREKQGKSKQKANNKRFCDKMSSHMMRRTAITTLLVSGMPEHLVRKISGHSHASKSFNRYVHYAQPYLDKEIDKVYLKLQNS